MRTNFTMLSRLKLLLSLILMAIPVAMSENNYQDDQDGIINGCIAYIDELAGKEDQYTRKGKRSPAEPDLFEPQIPPLKVRAYNKEKNQRVFECITNRLDGSYDKLKNNHRYGQLQATCRSQQPQPQCDPSYPYRTIDGTCNNLYNPKWGSVLSCARRLYNASYIGSSYFRKSKCQNQDLPNPREISRNYMTNLYKPDPLTSSHFMYFGQFLAHDLGDAPVTFVRDKHLACCKNRGKPDQHPQCAPINISRTDPHYSQFDVTCFNFIRTAPCDTCSVGKRIHMNEPPGYMDLHVVYGFTDDEAGKLRRNDGSGKLKSQPNEKTGELLPGDPTIEPFRCGAHLVTAGAGRKKRSAVPGDASIGAVDGAAGSVAGDGETDTDPASNEVEHCFKAGDRRANQHTPLMIYHTMFQREHNRICDVLKTLNPWWDDEKLYQEARKINGAQFQAIVYKEYLPHLLIKFMAVYDLFVSNGARTKYDPQVDPTLWTEFSTAAFRLHSMIDKKISLFGYDIPESSYVRHLFQDSYPVYNDKMEAVIENLGTWNYQMYDKHVVDDLTKYLYKERAGHFGFDLAAVNIQRGRDNGLPSYVDVLKYMSNGAVDIKTFEDLLLYVDPKNIPQLKSIYCDVGDIDLWVGLNSELKEPDMIISTTAAKIIGQQFQALKTGDRFYFEHPGLFTDDQLKELLKASLSRIFCDNSKITHIQPNSIEYPSPINIIQPCDTLPKVDLSKWKE